MTENSQKILIVDGDHLILYGLSKALRKIPFEVVAAPTAAQALLNLDCTCPALCLINCRLPDANGLELMDEIRKRCPEVKIVLMTASFIRDPGMREKIKAAVRGGECLLLAKPFNLGEAMDLVLKAVAGDRDLQRMRPMEDIRLEEKRKYRRKPSVKLIEIFANTIGEGEVRRESWRAVSTDISDEGIGLLINFPLLSRVISFGEEFSRRTGEIAWSSMLDSRLCRVGARFV